MIGRKSFDESAVPEGLRPFRFHGVDIAPRDGYSNSIGECPFCGKGKFHVNQENGKWDCKVCGRGTGKGEGNPLGFVRLLYEACKGSAVAPEYAALRTERGLERADTLTAWGVVKSITTGEWLVPAYTPDGRLINLYRYARLPAGMRLLSTTGMSHGLFGVPLADDRAAEVHFCEGPWDGMAWWEVMKGYKLTEGGSAIPTTNPGVSVGASVNVFATPGCSVFNEQWSALCPGKTVTFMYDNDYPPKKRENETRQQEAPGYAGMKRAARVLASSSQGELPAAVRWLRWGEHGYDLNRPDGFDVRDFLKEFENHRRGDAGLELQKKFEAIPADWVKGRSGRSNRSGSLELEPLQCESWRELENQWRKGMKWLPGLRGALACTIATILSTPADEDQLWMKIVGPPSCGKTTIAEAAGIARKHVICKSCIRGMHSGFKSEKGGDSGEDNSLLVKSMGKCLIIKDADTLLQAPNLGQIMSELRDVYDGSSRTDYRNKMGKDYEGFRMTNLLYGTSSLRLLDDSELGQRYLDWVVMEKMDEETEEAINYRRGSAQIRALTGRGIEKTEDGGVPEEALLTAKRMTAGYILHLMYDWRATLEQVEMTEDAVASCSKYSQFVAFLRGRPSKKQQEEEYRELSGRLMGQMTRLTACLTAVLGKREPDDEVMAMVNKVARDTCRGRTFNIVRFLYEKGGDDGLETRTVVHLTGKPEEEEKRLLRYLRAIEAVRLLPAPKRPGSTGGANRWHLTPRLRSLYETVFGERGGAE